MGGKGANLGELVRAGFPVPPGFVVGCSQGARTRGAPLLVRNYDYPASRLEGVITSTAWTGRRVIGSFVFIVSAQRASRGCIDTLVQAAKEAAAEISFAHDDT